MNGKVNNYYLCTYKTKSRREQHIHKNVDLTGCLWFLKDILKHHSEVNTPIYAIYLKKYKLRL